MYDRLNKKGGDVFIAVHNLLPSGVVRLGNDFDIKFLRVWIKLAESYC